MRRLQPVLVGVSRAGLHHDGEGGWRRRSGHLARGGGEGRLDGCQLRASLSYIALPIH